MKISETNENVAKVCLQESNGRRKNTYISKFSNTSLNYEKEVSNESMKSINILGGHSWTFSHIMPSVMRHDNPTKEHGKNTTKITQLQ